MPNPRNRATALKCHPRNDDSGPPEKDHKLTYAFDRFFVIKK